MSEELNPQTIYQYDHHLNIPWNIPQYDPFREYYGKSVDTNHTTRYVTKKGFYMDGHIKVVKDLPSPDKYPTKSAFDQTLNRKHSHKVKINPRLKKASYLDEIQLLGKKSKNGVGSYNLEKTEKEIEAEIKHMAKYVKTDKANRPSFYQDIQVLSQSVPGPGCCNPHLDVQHTKNERMSPEKWRSKHTKQDKDYIKRKRKQPGPCSYRPASAGTFDRFKLDTQRERKKKSKSFNRSFGTDAKFQYCRPSKKKILEQRPDPTRYDMSIPWRGKKDDTKQHGWKSFRSTRSNSLSVYNCY